MFQNVDAYAGDPILSLMEAFQQDPRADKVNLSIGLYYNEQAIIPQLEAVRQAADRLQSQQQKASLYLPMEGLAPYRRAVQTLLFGDKHPALRAGRIATIQTLGGSGVLKVGADFLKRYFPDSAVWVSDPTWENHVAIFAGAGFEVHTYPWFDSATRGVNFPAMLAALQQLPPRSIVLLHPCCHNPTGADLTREQWDRVIEVLIGRELIPFLDIAYQGFGRGLDEDAYAIRAIASAGLTALVSNSFSKIFSLYGERVGGLSVVCDNADIAGRVLGQLKATVRRNYSSPPGFGAQVGKPGELRAAGAYLGGGDRHSALSRLFRPGKAERKDRVQRAAGSQGTQKTAAGRPARRINDQVQVTHRLLHCGDCIVDNAIRAELT